MKGWYLKIIVKNLVDFFVLNFQMAVNENENGSLIPISFWFLCYWWAAFLFGKRRNLNNLFRTSFQGRFMYLEMIHNKVKCIIRYHIFFSAVTFSWSSKLGARTNQKMINLENHIISWRNFSIIFWKMLALIVDITLNLL